MNVFIGFIVYIIISCIIYKICDLFGEADEGTLFIATFWIFLLPFAILIGGIWLIYKGVSYVIDYLVAWYEERYS